MRRWTGSALAQVMACRGQSITWTNADLLSIWPLGTNFSEIWIEIQNFLSTKMHLNVSSAKWRPFCPGGDELTPVRKDDYWFILWCWNRNIRGELGQFHCCWWPGSLRRQVISNHGFDHTGQTGPKVSILRWIISITSMLRNDRRYKCAFILPRIYPAR